jgi:hypothetical protein
MPSGCKKEAGNGRPVPLTRPDWAVLDFWSPHFPNRKPEHFVFPACETGHVAPERPIANWHTAWRRACDNAQLVGLRFHDVRHTAATKTLGARHPVCRGRANLGLVGKHGGPHGETLRSYPARGATAGFGSYRDTRNSDRCAPKCAPSGNCVRLENSQLIDLVAEARSSVWLERYLDTVEVNGSSPFGPTMPFNNLPSFRGFGIPHNSRKCVSLLPDCDLRRAVVPATAAQPACVSQG